MTIKVNFHDANGINKTLTLKYTQGKEKAVVVNRPEKGVWLELVDDQTNTAPQRIFTKRVGDNLFIHIDDKTDTPPELIIVDYYEDEEVAPILGKDVDQVYHAYVSEVGRADLAIAELSPDTLAGQILAKEAFIFTPAFPAWWLIGGALGGVGLVGLALGGGSGGGSASNGNNGNNNNNGNTPVKPNPVVFDPKKPLDGSISFDLNGADKAEITYTPTGGQPKTVVISKGQDGKYVSNDPNVIVDPTTGKVTIPEDKVADNTPVTVVVTKDGLSSAPAKTDAGKDALTFTNETNPVDGDGSVKFDLDGADGAKVTYTPSDSDTPVTAEITKDADGKYVSNDPNVNVDPNTGVVVIPEDKIKDNSPVEVVIINNGQESDPQKTTAGEDHVEGTIDSIKDTDQHTPPKVTAITDKSNPADDNPETFVVEGKTRPNADVVIKDKEGNIVGKGTADANGNYKINVVETDKHDIVPGEELTVTTKADGFNPSEEKATISPDTPINYTGDKTGPQNRPVISTDPATGEATVEFPKDGETEKVNVDVTPKGEDPITIEVSKDKNGNVTVEVKDQDGNTVGGKESLPNGITVDGNGNVIISKDTLETGSNIEATGEDKAGNPSDTAVAEVTDPANPSATTPEAPELTANLGGSVTAALPPAAVKDDKAVLEFNKEGTNEPVKVTLVKTLTGWVVDSTEPAGLNDLVAISGDTATIPEKSVADGSIVTAYSQGKDDAADQKSATKQVKVLPDEETTLEDTIKVTSYNDSNPAKNDITKVLVEGQTEPNAKVQIKEGDVVVAEGVADASGKFRIEFAEPTNSDFQPKDKLTVIATAPNKLPSEQKEGEIPEIAQDSTGFVGDRVAPETPRLVVGKDGENTVTITPKDPKPGDVITIVVKDNKGNDVELTVKVGEDGTLTPSTDNADKPALTVNPDGTITLDRTQIKDDSTISVTAKDLAGNTSEPASKNTGFDNVTKEPTIDSIVSKDTSPKADGNPEEFTISGKAPAGSKVTAKDSQGNVIGSTIANEDGTYTITGAYENPNNDIKTGDNITVVAQEVDAQGNPTAAESRPVQKDVSAPAEFSDVIPTKEPEILEPENNGDIPVKLPEDAVKGDRVTIKVGNNDNGDDTLTDDEVDGTVIVEKQEDGTWKPVGGTDTSLVKDPIDGNIAIIPDEKAPNGSVIEVESKDVAGNTSSTEKPVNKLEQTETPKIESIQAKDSSNPADGNPEYVVITGTAEPGAVVTVKDPEGNVIGTGIADATTGRFEIKATELTGTDLVVGDKLSVTAQHPAKTESEPATTLASGEDLAVPALQPKVDFEDSVPPSPAEIGKADEKGDIPVTLPEDAVKGDQAEITVKQPDGTESTVVVEKQEDGTWKPVDGDTTLVKDPIEGNVATIPADKAPAGTEIDVVVKDIAGNESKPAEATVGEENTDEPTEITDTPKVSEIKAIDTSNPADKNPEQVEVSGTTKEPNTTVYVKDKDGNIIGQGTSSATPDENGEYPFTVTGIELTGKDVLTGDNLTVTAEKEGKKESPAATETTNGDAVKVPEVADGKEGHPNDRTSPTAPDVTQEGENIIVKLPEDAQVGDKVVISKTTDTNNDGVVDDKDTPISTTVVKGEDDKWTVEGTDELGIGDKINNDEGTVTVPANNGDIVDAKTVDIAGNESTTDQETVTTPPEQTPTPKDIEITAVDKSNPADTIAEEIIVKGKVDDVPEGTEVRVEDKDGNVIGMGKTDAEGNFEIVVPNDPANPLTEGDKLNVIAEDKAGGKTPSDAGTGLNGTNTNVPAIDPTADGHPNDPTGPSAPQLSKVPGTGAVMVTFPTDANAGDKVEVSYTKEGATEPTKVTFTKQPDGTWTSSNEAELPSVKDNLSNPQVVIPENSIEDGSEVNAKSIDAIIAGAEKAADPIKAGADAKTATPTFEIVSVDTAAQADGEVDQIKVTGETEAGSLVIVYNKDGQEIARVQLEDGETQFSIEIGETAGPLTKDDEISVVAKAKDKEPSDPATNNIPEVTEFKDEKAPNAPTVAENPEKGKGDVTITLPAEDPADPFVKDDQLIIKYTDQVTGKEQTATLTHDGKGNWNSDNANVPSITAGNNSTTIPEDKVQDKSEVSAILKDVAGNESPATDTSKATAGFDDISRKPTAEITKATDSNNDGNPDSVTLAGELKDETGAPLANALITVMGKDAQGEDVVLGTTTTNAEGKYEITLEASDTVPASAIEAADTLKVTAIEQADNAPSRDESEAASVTVPAVTKLAENPTIVGISTNEKSDRTPELFKISGTSEEGATVTAYAKLANGDLVEIGSVEVANGDAFTLTTKPLAEIDGLDSYSLGDAATEIVLKATKAGQQDSATRDLKAVEVPRAIDSEETRKELHPSDSAEIPATEAATVKALPKGFGGANITLPSTEGESLLEVIITYPSTTGETKPVTLTWENNKWTSSDETVIAAPTEAGDNVVNLPASKVAAKDNTGAANSVSVVTRDYAGNTSQPATAELKDAADNDNTELTVDGQKDRTDLPTLVAGSDNNSGDMVATSGADNDALEVVYFDNNGDKQTVKVEKDLDEGTWKFVGDDKGATLTVDPETGKVTVTIPAANVKDFTEVEAIGYKEKVPSTAQYTDENDTLPIVVHVTAFAKQDDSTPTTAETPEILTQAELTDQALLGGAQVKPASDNVQMAIEFTGYVNANGSPVTKDASTESAGTGTAPAPTEKDLVLVAKKDPANGEWALYVTTKENYDANKADPAKLESVLSVAPNNIATIDENGVVTLKPTAVKDNSTVTATGYNADAVASTPATPENVGAEPADKDVDADEPTISQLSNGKVSATPVGDNTKMEVEYTKPNGETAKVNVEKVDGKWKFAGSDLPTDLETGLINKDGITLNPTDGTVVIPKEQLQVPSTASAVGTNADNYTSDKVDTPVVKDPTLTADAPLAYAQGDNVVVVPGNDNEKVVIKGSEPEMTIVKQPDGKWAFEGNKPDGVVFDEKTGTVTIPNDKVTAGGIVATGTDGNGATADSNGGEPVKLNIPTDPTPESVEKPDIAAINDGADKGGVLITPKAEHTRLSVSYEKEEANKGTGTLTAVKNPQTGAWELEPLFENGESVPVPATVATINPETGAITLYAYEVKDGSTVSAIGTNSAGKSSDAATADAPSNPNTVADKDQPTVSEEEKKEIEESGKVTTETKPANVTFKNDGVGKVIVTADEGVTSLEFKVLVDTVRPDAFSGQSITDEKVTIKLNKENGVWKQTIDSDNDSGFKVAINGNQFILQEQNGQYSGEKLRLAAQDGENPAGYWGIRTKEQTEYITEIKVNGEDKGRFKLDAASSSTIEGSGSTTATPDFVDTPVVKRDAQNKGGMEAGKGQAANDKTAKFSITYVDENDQQQVLTFDKGTDGNWKAADGTTLPTGVSISNPTNGLVTIAPSAVKDGSKVIVRSYDAKGKLRATGEGIADFELDVTQTKIGKNETNIGDVWVAPGDETQTTKFEVAFTDESKIAHTLTVNNNNGTWSIDQTLLAQDPSLKKLVDDKLIKLDADTGKVSFDREAVLDESRVVIRPYNSKGQMVSNKVNSIMTDIDKIVTALDNPATPKVSDPTGYIFISDKGYTNGLRQLLSGYGGNSKPTPYENSYPNGRNLEFSDNNDVVKVDKSIGHTALAYEFPHSFYKNDSKYLKTLNFNFNKGDDILVVGYDLGTYNKQETGRVVTTVNMGEGNDILVVGAHNNDYKVVRHTASGKLSIAPAYGSQEGWEVVEELNMGWIYGGQLRNANVNMGDGDDTVLLKGINSGEGNGSYQSVIDLGEGNNRLVLSPELSSTKAFTASTVKAGSGVDVVSGGIFNGGSVVSLGGGNDEFVTKELADATIQLGDGNDWAEVSAFIKEGAKVDLGSGNDVFKQGAFGNDADIVQGGSGVDLYWIASPGASAGTNNVHGFEHILMDANTKFSLKSDHIMSLEGPMKITAYENTTGQTVDLGINGTRPGDNSTTGVFYETDSYAWRKNGSVTENGVTYDKYYYNNGSANVPEVWIENGIQVI